MLDTGFIDRSLFSALLEAETLLPFQFFDRVKVEPLTQPEKRLMLAVLEEAIRTFQKCLAGTTFRQRRLFREVEEWFASDDVTWLFSFQNICAALDLDADYLRHGLREWKARQLARQNPPSSNRQGHSRRHIPSTDKRLSSRRTKPVKQHASIGAFGRPSERQASGNPLRGEVLVLVGEIAGCIKTRRLCP